MARSRVRCDRYSGSSWSALGAARARSGALGGARAATGRADTTCVLRNSDGYNSLTKIICVTKPRYAQQADLGHAPAGDMLSISDETQILLIP